jgi:hypothetical protein
MRGQQPLASMGHGPTQPQRFLSSLSLIFNLFSLSCLFIFFLFRRDLFRLSLSRFSL